MKKLLTLVLALALCLVSLAALAEEEKQLPEGMTESVVPILMEDDGQLVTYAVMGAFLNGDTSVMYMSVRDFYDLLKELTPAYAVEVIQDEGGLIASRANGSSVEFQREDNSFLFEDVDLFNLNPMNSSGGDRVTTEPYQTDDNDDILLGEDGQPLIFLIERKDSTVSFSRSGAMVGASLDDFEIPAFWTDDDLYLPMAVLNNLFRAGSYYKMVYLNQVLFVYDGAQPDDTATDENGLTMLDYYYANEDYERPEALVQLNYHLLCLELTLNYGLSSEHGILDGMDDYLETIGLKEQMLDPDGRSFYNALITLTDAYLADFHSAVDLAGPYAGPDYSYKVTSGPASNAVMTYSDDHFAEARYLAGLTDFVDGDLVILNNYEEVGDTAFITFDTFEYQEYDYYSAEFREHIADYIAHDNFALISYANSQITREGSPIRKVVVDLSCNGGGAVNAGVYLTSWLLGTCRVSTVNPVTDAKYTVVYQADVDLDGRITEADHLDTNKYELYCLISGSSFSCGNLVPALCKESGLVTLLGQTSGGGACVVRPSITADGTVFKYSGNTLLCTVQNGSYYSVDQGVEPDFVIRHASNYYDRQWLSEYLDTLP